VSKRPVPHANPLAKPYWDGCTRGELVIQRCRNSVCGKYVFYPRACCPHCHGGDLEWERISGKGVITSYTLVHRPQHEAFYEEAPVCFIAVRLDEGPILYSQLLDTPANANLLAAPVRAVFREVAAGFYLPYFHLEEISAGAAETERNKKQKGR
jgi:uncharacterized protein